MEKPLTEKQERRARKKKLVADVRSLLEFYFSGANLTKDAFMKKLLKDSCFIDIDVFLNFNKLKALTTEAHIIKKAVDTSEVLQLDEEGTGIGRIAPFQEKTNELECTIYVENLPVNAEHDYIKDIFGEYGTIDYISLPRYKNSGQPKGFAFVEYSTPEGAHEALVAYGSPILMGPTVKPEELQSVITHKKEGADVAQESPTPNPSDKKRPRPDTPEDGEIPEAKKQKTSEEIEQQDPQSKKKKKRKRTKKEKVHESAAYLRVMSKQQWKRLRNTYLDTQRKNFDSSRTLWNSEQYFSNTFTERTSLQEKTESKSNLPSYLPNVIVKIIKNPPPEDVNSYRKAILERFEHVAFVDSKKGESNIFVRFKNPEGAVTFLQESKETDNVNILEGAEEAIYWEHIFTSWNQAHRKKKKDPKNQVNRQKPQPGTYKNPWAEGDKSRFQFK